MIKMNSGIEKAQALLRKGNVNAAKKICRKLLKISPNSSACLHLLAQIDFQAGHLDAAADKLFRAVQSSPEEVVYRVALANIYYFQRQYEKAEIECQKIIQLDGENADVYNLLGLIARDRVDYDNAISYFSRAITLNVPNIPALQNYSTVLHRIGQNQLSEKYNRLILKLQPDNIDAHINLGMSLRGQGRLQDARETFKLVEKDPRARFNIGFILMMEKNLEEGLPLYELRKSITGTNKKYKKPEWNGKSQTNKTLLVTSEQGMGDTILMSRFFSQLRSHFKHVIIQVDKPLVRLTQSIDDNLEVVDKIGQIDYDFWCDSMSLPYMLGLDNVDKIPTQPWFDIPTTQIRSDKLKVGINWAGNPDYPYDRIRSTSLANLGKLFEVQGVEWFSLHKGCAELEAHPFNLEIPLASSEDLYDTASVISGLDMVISTETAVPNLAGALGVPTCVLTNPDVDWRWDAWYDNVRVCQQIKQGDWSGSVSLAQEALEELLQLKSSNFSPSSLHMT